MKKRTSLYFGFYSLRVDAVAVNHIWKRNIQLHNSCQVSNIKIRLLPEFCHLD